MTERAFIMSNAEKNERSAIADLTAAVESIGYKRALKAGISVTFLSHSKVVCVHNGKRTVVGKVTSSGRKINPKTYNLK